MSLLLVPFKRKIQVLRKELFREPALMEKKGSFSFSITVEDKCQQDHGDNILEGYRTIGHVNFEIAEFIDREIDVKIEYIDKFLPLVCSRAQNQEPLLSGLTTFNRIDIPASLDPLNGLYVGSNGGYLVTEVIQVRRIFGQLHKDISTNDLFDYIEVVKLTGDPDVPAGQVAFRGKVGGKYKLPPQVLYDRFGVVARYRGQGRMTGFQNARWVDTDLLILSGEYANDGFAIGFLHSAPEYYFLKLFKQLKLPNLQDLADLDF